MPCMSSSHFSCIHALMATFQAPLQNVAVAFLADGNGFGKGKFMCTRNTKVACSMDVPQRRDILLINAFCWCNLGNVKWRCCNCAKDIKFGVTTLTPAQYGLFLCSTKACCDVGRTCIDDTDVYSCSSHATLTIMCAEKTACIQCKNRPRELCFQMRQEHFALTPPQVGFDCSAFGPEGYVNFAACIPE